MTRVEGCMASIFSLVGSISGDAFALSRAVVSGFQLESRCLRRGATRSCRSEKYTCAVRILSWPNGEAE